ncbi:phenylalanine-tRNA synthetase family protein, alpha subunit [Naegleria gruberi]|uniref:phenylalanine--tRNA ligase n=1 Tax=Naegleria gruberi TaxID=5762 RepID=D2VDQ1_NAEGR|nr:phenylalanine-tRNA synthetase family protein, alpha subunit [Naegleria gruberi]EFC44935.1 phenylalanine-tRNA synthetase family protein, alpha subunit [Naegleria gruberi]|eukprot:XP_002677679.1 phenylalanine-tRNA synthetase family protein, alpha subunit [Naegleria gruberi strain NEG-M]
MEESALLSYVHTHGAIENSVEFAQSHNIDHQQFYGQINSLSLANILVLEKRECTSALPSTEGLQILNQGQSAEIKLLAALINSPDGVDKNVLQQQLGDNYLPAFKACMKNKWISQEKGSDILKKSATVSELPKDVVVDQLKIISASGFVFLELEKQKGKSLEDLKTIEFANLKVQDDKDPRYTELKKACIEQGKCINSNDFTELKSRKLVKVETIKFFYVSKGTEFALERKKQETDLTTQMILSNEWQNASFKEYNFKATGKRNENGYLHTLLKVRTEFRKVFLELGFEEMATNNFVESSFWNFDALFQPQQHPARDAHDTFFLENPKQCISLPTDGYLEDVKKIHEEGGFGSIGYRYDWKVEESKKNLLRTHTTAVSTRYLRKLGEELSNGAEFKPRKYFSIDRVFRNEAPDATHLCEFHQIEGMVIDKGLTLGDMIGLFRVFFAKIGITDLKFKPAFNPYTEPSMEIFGYHPMLKKWVEVGNSGMFRPEMLRPMGLPEDVTVLAWGLSLERPTMIKYSVDNIRDLVGHKVDLGGVQKNPICRLNK